MKPGLLLYHRGAAGQAKALAAAAEMYAKAITFHTGRAHAREAMPHVLELAASGALRPEAITSRVVAWADAAEARGEADWTKLVISR